MKTASSPKICKFPLFGKSAYSSCVTGSADISVDKQEFITLDNGVITATGVGETAVRAKDGNTVYEYAVEVKADARTEFKLDRGYFYGKKVIFYGDSISAKVGVSGAGKDYIDNLKAALGCNSSVVSEGGALFTHWTAKGYNRKSAAEFIVGNAENNATADYAVLFFGTNDFARRVAFGTRQDDPAALDDVKTFRGAIKFCVKNLRKDNPNLKILLLTPLIRTDRTLTNDIGNKLEDYGAVIEEMAEVLSCRAINLYGLFTEKDMQSGSKYTSDGLHPNAAGHKVISDYLLSKDS